MGLFSSNKNYLGIDFGTSSIKMVELELEKGRPKLVTYGYIEEAINIVKSDKPEDQEKTVASIKRLLKESRATSRRAVSALPPYAVFSSIISLPIMPNKDLVSAVRWEAKKFVPMPLEEMILDWKVIEEKEPANLEIKAKPENLGERVVTKEKNAKNLQILLTAAPKNLVKRYLDTFKKSELQLASLETEAFALERSLVGEDKSAIMIIDIGALGTHVTIISDGVPVLNRSIDIGGTTITKAIADSMNIDLDRADQFKRDVGMSMTGGSDQIPKTIEFVISSIINEIKYCFNIYQNQEVKAIEKIILAGGSSFLLQLPEYLAKVLNIKVLIGDPWSRIVYPIELEPILKEIGPKFAVAVGLAMRNLV